MADDGLQKNRDGFSTRLRAGKGQQLRVTICVHDRRVAVARRDRLQRMSQALTAKGLTSEAAFLIKKAAAQIDEAAFELCIQTGSSLAPASPAGRRLARTFRELGELWTSGELHRLYPDHVKKKASSEDDASRLGWLYQSIGHIPLERFVLGDALVAMRSLPETAKRPATRRQYAQAIAKVLKYAVFPCQLIDEYPLPSNFLPKLTRGDVVFPYLYPSEDLKAMACLEHDLTERVFFGLLNREGMRVEEALSMRWAMQDRVNGVINIGTRKNGRAGTWAASEGTLEALWATLRDQTKDGPFERLPNDDKYAARLRTLLKRAKVERHELFHDEPGRRKLRAHDLRATFVTLALANGQSEAWVSQRTGHMSSGQVNGYRRQAATAAELRLGPLAPLDVALGLRRPSGEMADESSSGEGVTEPVTEYATPGCNPGSLPSDSLGGYARVPKTGLEPVRPCGRRILNAPSGDGNTQFREVEPPGSDQSPPPVTASGGGVSQPPTTLLGSLEAAAHAAVTAGDWTTVAELGRLIDKARAAASPAIAPVSDIEAARRRREGK